MPLVVGVTFRRVGKVYYFDPGELGLHEGDFCIAETARGVEFGEVVLEPRPVPEEELVAPLKRVIRVATGDDLERESANRDRERHAYEVCERKIVEHNLPMKLLEAEFAFDGSQVTFSFSADGRIDFRELVKDVAGSLKTKVQLHQIGVRDEARLIGGYGTCGRSLCCATFLTNFDPISMKMAKDQSLFLNPAKFSGACGKLMCCLRYEHEYYKQAQKRLPAVGAVVALEQGRGRVIDVNVISNVITLATEEDVQVHIHASQLKLDGICRKHGIACNMTEQSCSPLVFDEDYAYVPTESEEVVVDEDVDLHSDTNGWEDAAPRFARDSGPTVPKLESRSPAPEPGPKQTPQPGMRNAAPGVGDEVAPVTMWRKPGEGPKQGEQAPKDGERRDRGPRRRRNRQGGDRPGGENRPDNPNPNSTVGGAPNQNQPGNRRRSGNQNRPNQGPNRPRGNGGNGGNGGQGHDRSNGDKPNNEPKSE